MYVVTHLMYNSKDALQDLRVTWHKNHCFLVMYAMIYYHGRQETPQTSINQGTYLRRNCLNLCNTEACGKIKV